MTEEANLMTCHEFQAQLPEMIGSGESRAAHAHLRHFPIVEPPDHLWEQIESAIKKEKAVFEPDEGKE